MARERKNYPSRATDPRPKRSSSTATTSTSHTTSVKASAKTTGKSTTVVSELVFTPPVTRCAKKQRVLDGNMSAQEDETISNYIQRRSSSENKRKKGPH